MPAADATPGAPADELPPAVSPSAGTLVTLGVAVIGALYLGREVLVPLAFAILISFALAPVASRLRRLGLGRVPSVVLVVALAVGLLAGFVWLLAYQAIGLAQELPRYEYTLREKIRAIGQDTAGTSVFERTADVLERLQAELQRATARPERPAAAAEAPSQPRPVPVVLHQPPLSPMATIAEFGRRVAEPLATLGIMLIFVIFGLIQREDLRDRFIRLVGGRDVHRTTEAMNDAGGRIGRHLLRQLAANLLFGILLGVALGLIGVPNPALWGLLGAVLRFVPFVGSPAALLLPLAVSVAVAPDWTMPVLTFLAYLAIELVLVYVVEPRLGGRGTGLSVLALIVATLFWTLLWGIPGLLLAAPLTACLVVIGHHVPQLAFLEVILGNVPVLPTHLKVYQRLLAGDAIEAREVAAEHAEEHGLPATADSVLLPVLELVSSDRDRDLLDAGRTFAVADQLIAIAADLAPAVEAEGAVICAGAGSRLDEAAAAVAAAALGAAGIPAVRVIGLDQVLARPPGTAVLLATMGSRGARRAMRARRRLVARGHAGRVLMLTPSAAEGQEGAETVTSLAKAARRLGGAAPIEPSTPAGAPLPAGA